MHNKISKKDLLITSIKERDAGLSYIHCPYPLQNPFIETVFVKSMLVVVSTDQNTTCCGCIFIQLDPDFISKIRSLLLHIRFQIIIIELPPTRQDIYMFLCHFLLRLQQLCNFWSVHCIILDRSKKSCCKDWPIFSLVICFNRNILGFAIHKNVV